jgi:hypothetical protein
MLKIVLEEKKIRKGNDNIPNKVGPSRMSLPPYSLFRRWNWPLKLRGSLVVVNGTNNILCYMAEGTGSA